MARTGQWYYLLRIVDFVMVMFDIRSQDVKTCKDSMTPHDFYFLFSIFVMSQHDEFNSLCNYLCHPNWVFISVAQLVRLRSTNLQVPRSNIEGAFVLFFYQSNTFLKSRFFPNISQFFNDNFKSNACLNFISWRNITIGLLLQSLPVLWRTSDIVRSFTAFKKNNIILKLPCNGQLFMMLVQRKCVKQW